MIRLIFKCLVLVPDPGKGTPGEAFPTFSFGLHAFEVDEEREAELIVKIQREHREHIRTAPASLARSCPEAVLVKRECVELDYQI